MEFTGKTTPYFALRNKAIETLINQYQLPIILVGIAEKPSLIYKQKVCLSATVRDYILRFFDSPTDGDILLEINLKDYNPEALNRQKIITVIEQSEHRPIYMIKHSSTDLFFSGLQKEFNHLYPVFSRVGYRIYFTRLHAQKQADLLLDDSYPVRVFVPKPDKKL